MPVQDDERERELVRMFNLAWIPPINERGSMPCWISHCTTGLFDSKSK
jgi:hypothetical protein